MPESTLNAILKYLNEKFPDTSVAPMEPASTGDVRLNVGDMPLRISAEFLEAVEPAEVASVLDWLDLAGELRRAQGLPMVLTQHGVKLESSN